MKRRDVLRVMGAAGVGLTMPAGTLAQTASADSPAPRERVRLADGWRFHLGHATDLERDFGFGRFQRTFAKVQEDSPPATRPGFNDSDWSEIRVPHDWAVALPFAHPLGPLPAPADRDIKDRVAAHGFKAIGREYPENSIGWYRRALPVSPADRDRQIWLEFDGVFRDCLVFVNGCIVGENGSGYAPFRVDLTDFLDYDGGANVLTVRVDASLGEGWFYEGAGIYRHVDLVKAAPTHVPQWGTVVRAEPDGTGATVHIATDVAHPGPSPARIRLRRAILAPDGSEATRLPDELVALDPNATVTRTADFRLANAMLWSIETPRLYRLVTELWADERLIDRTETDFGIRSIRFDADKGFFLNGQPVKLLGTCNHQDHAGVGTAIPDRLNAWRVEQLQAMGSNAWRSSHNPPSEALLDICDAKGMLMIVELRRNTTDPQALDELDRIVRRDRNHPCVILWSAGNEEPQQGMDRGKRITAQLKRRIVALDPTRPVTQAFYFEDKGYHTGAWDVVDVAGLNYRTDQAEVFHRQFPHLPIIGTETASTVATRGVYENDTARHLVRAYDTEYPAWASTGEQWWPIAAENSFFAGGFVWTGFDYRGEPTPYPEWPSVSSQFGILDLCGFPKDNYWYYRAWWRPGERMVHLLPHWNWEGREGRPIDVWAHGNCEEIELFLNGRSQGRKPMPRNRHLAWSVPYSPGRIEARGYVGGRMVAHDARETAGPAAALRLTADRTRLDSKSGDVAVIRVEVVDKAGHVVPRGDALVHFALEGPARLIGVGNGDPNSHEPDQASQRRAFNGLAQAIVQTDGTAGPVRLMASAQGLNAGAAALTALPFGGEPKTRRGLARRT
jgi:beta-galactosidase